MCLHDGSEPRAGREGHGVSLNTVARVKNMGNSLPVPVKLWQMGTMPCSGDTNRRNLSMYVWQFLSKSQMHLHFDSTSLLLGIYLFTYTYIYIYTHTTATKWMPKVIHCSVISSNRRLWTAYVSSLGIWLNKWQSSHTMKYYKAKTRKKHLILKYERNYKIQILKVVGAEQYVQLDDFLSYTYFFT